jgi:hypothetical protein
VGTVVLDEPAGLANCANPVAGNANTQTIADMATPDDQRRMCSFKKAVCSIILAT